MQNEWRKIYLCRNTIIEMLIDRGYSQNTTTELLSDKDFMARYPSALTHRNSLQIIVSHKNTNEQLIVHFFDESKVGLKSLKLCMDAFERQGIQNIIFVCREGLSPAGMKFVSEYKSVEVFKESQLLFNLTKHILVPKHRIMSIDEKERYLKKHKIKEHQLPIIRKNDPVSRYYGVKKGDVFEIIRKSETAGETIYYRIVV